MLIDWFTVAAQAVNFLLLVWLLKRFLFTPIRKAMRERNQRIQQDLDQAENARNQARQKRQELEEERGNLDKERRQILDQAREEARQWREQAMESAKADVEEQRRAWREALREEQQAFARRLTTGIAETSLTVCRKALQDLADADLETRLAGKMLAELPANGHAPPQKALVRTGFPPGDELKQRLRQGLQKKWPDLKDIAFEHSQDIGFGIECLLDQDKISWNASRYISGLEQRVLSAFSRLEADTEQTPERDDNGS